MRWQTDAGAPESRSWMDHSVHGPAALPLNDFKRHLLAGAIVYTDTDTVSDADTDQA
jgi:hypothetical protein